MVVGSCHPQKRNCCIERSEVSDDFRSPSQGETWAVQKDIMSFWPLSYNELCEVGQMSCLLGSRCLHQWVPSVSGGTGSTSLVCLLGSWLGRGNEAELAQDAGLVSSALLVSSPTFLLLSGGPECCSFGRALCSLAGDWHPEVRGEPSRPVLTS